MIFRTRKMISAKDLNSNGTLFGGRVLEWIDEEAFIFASCQINSSKMVTKCISNIEFISTARIGDIVEIGIETIKFGKTSISLSCIVRNKITMNIITEVSELVFVKVDAEGRPVPHGITSMLKQVI